MAKRRQTKTPEPALATPSTPPSGAPREIIPPAPLPPLPAPPPITPEAPPSGAPAGAASAFRTPFTDAADAIARVAAGELDLFTADRARKVVVEMARRRYETLNLYEPLPEQEAFHRSLCRQRLVRGSNRAGKTLCAAAEVARALVGSDPHGKYRTEAGRVIAVGKSLDHVGQVMWRKLGRPGAFKIIKDALSGRWRAYRPWTPEDIVRQKESRDAPPLLPPRLIHSIAWENKAKGIPKQVTLKNGWEVNFYSSEGKPPQGSDIDLWWFDEEIVDQEWHPEMVARVVDRGGRGVWSATPQAATEKLLELHDLADSEKGKERPAVEEFVTLLVDNPHIGDQEKRDFAAGLSEDEHLVRVAGEFRIHAFRVFPEFSPILHGCHVFDVPSTWTHYMVVDPGRQICAVLFAAVSPPEDGEHTYLFDELYIPNCDAVRFGQAVRHKCQGRNYEGFIIDRRGSRVTEMGSGRTVEEQYSRALKKNKVRCRRTGHGFAWGSDDVQGALEACRELLRTREATEHDVKGSPPLRVFLERMPNFDWEIKRYRYKRADRTGLTLTDKPEDKGRVHLMACFRYLSAARLRYVKPHARGGPATGALAAFRDKEKRRKAKSGSGRVRLGPGTGGPGSGW